MIVTKNWCFEEVDDGTLVTLVARGKTKSMVIHAPPQYIEEGLRKYNAGYLVQHAWHTLHADEREFLMTGITPEEWDAMFPPECR